MASPQHFLISHSTPTFLLILLLLHVTVPPPVAAATITSVLAAYPNLSSFSNLLSTTSIAGDLSNRSSLTILAVSNPFFLYSSALLSAGDDIADVLRYHILLEYLSPLDLRRIPATGKIVATLLQTTGRAPSNLGSLNLIRSSAGAGAVTARSPAPFSHSNATFLSFLKSIPYNLSIFTVDAILIPSGFNLTASESRPPLALNITQVLVDGGDFNVATSMLKASGVVEEFQRTEKGAGITFFVPTDEAFARLPATERLQSLAADDKALVLQFHMLCSYYPLGSLESIVNPVQPTLATANTAAGLFTLNITRVNGSVAINTGFVPATITRTVYDRTPVAVFAVSSVLLPPEVFKGERPDARVSATAPEYSELQPTRLWTPPVAEEMRSAAGRRLAVGICTGLLYLLFPLVSDPVI